MNTKHKGFTLIEVMVVIAIIGFLAVTGWREYDQYQTRVARAEAIAGLTVAANNMDKCAARQGNVYTNCALVAPPNPYYNITLPPVLNPPDNTRFMIAASRIVPNVDDTNCISAGVNYDLVINELGQLGIWLGVGDPIFGNTQQVRRCWNK